MDHLPTIENSQYPKPLVPCLCSIEDYDGQGVRGFPERKGWTIDYFKGPVRTDGGKHSIVFLASFVQSWLFFGPLCDVFQSIGIPLQRNRFVYQLDDKYFITTTSIQGYIDEWFDAAEVQNPKTRQIHRNLVRECFWTVDYFLTRFLDCTGLGRWLLLPHLDLDIVLSILILGESLLNAAEIIWTLPGQSREFRLRRQQNLLQDRLIQAGWCPSETSMLHKLLDNTGIYIASMIKRSVTLNHSNCASDKCLAHQVNEETYQTKHADDCPDSLNCHHLFADESKVCTILKNGGIPIIFIPQDNSDENLLRLRVIDARSNVLPFVAFSHVWAHELGNVKSNSLPYCQILRMKHLIFQLPFIAGMKDWGTAFWIDSLCIPVSPENGEFRKLAITRLADTFRGSSHVLVLDTELQRTSKACSRIELATRIICSGWMRRLWTLQEAVMTNENMASCTKLKIQFLNGPMEFNSLMQRNLFNPYYSENAVSTLYSFFPQYSDDIRTLRQLGWALEYRSTSKPKDEAICIASILGIKPEEIAQMTTHEERMRALYRRIKKLPSSILFHAADRLKLEGARWAPASLLGNHQSLFPFDAKKLDLPTTCSARGLHVKFFGYIVLDVPRDDRDETQNSFYIKEPEQADPSVCVRHRPGYNYSSNPLSKDSVELENLESQKFSKLMRETKTSGIIIYPNTQSSSDSVLIAVTSEEEGVIYGKFLSQVHTTSSPHFKDGLKKGSHKNWEKGLMRVRKLPPDQQWCIG